MAENAMQNQPATTVRERLAASMTASADKAAIITKREDGFHTYTYRRLRSDIEALGTAMLGKELQGGNIVIVGEGCYEWVLATLSVLYGVGTAIPIDHTLSIESLASLVEFCEPAAVIYDDNALSADFIPPKATAIRFSSLPALLEEGRGRINAGIDGFFKLKPSPDAAALIAFAATKKPKGVMLSNKNLCASLASLSESFALTANDKLLAALSPHHVYELVSGILLPLSCGASVAFGGGLRTLLSDMKEQKPTALVAIPAIVEALSRRVRARLDKGNGSAVTYGQKLAALLPPATVRNIKKKIFAELQSTFGGKLNRILCAGAPVDAQHLKLLSSIGLSVTEGYSLAECSGMAALNTPKDIRIGTAGKKLSGLTLDIYNMQEDGRGEIRVKGAAVMLGYYKDDALSAEVLRDGWLYTGDIGSLDKEGYLSIVGRKRNMMVTAGGKSIFPEELEGLLCRSRFIREAVVVGFVNEKKRDYDLVAVIRPDTAAMQEAYGEEYTLSDTNTEIASALEALTSNLPAYKKPMMFVLRELPFERNNARKLRRTGVAASVEEEYRRKLLG